MWTKKEWAFKAILELKFEEEAKNIISFFCKNKKQQQQELCISSY